jgi:hypothetical protein
MDGGIFIGEGMGYVVGNLFAKFLTKIMEEQRTQREKKEVSDTSSFFFSFAIK